MKWIHRLMILGVIGIAMGLPFFMEIKNGKPSVSLPDSASLIPNLSGTFGTDEPKAETSHSKAYMKWQDASGQWHYGDRPPSDALNLTTVSVNSNANIVQSFKAPEPEKASDEALDQHNQLAQKQRERNEEKEDMLSLDNALNLKNDAQAVVDTLNSRNEALSRFVGEK